MWTVVRNEAVGGRLGGESQQATRLDGGSPGIGYVQASSVAGARSSVKDSCSQEGKRKAGLQGLREGRERELTFID